MVRLLRVGSQELDVRGVLAVHHLRKDERHLHAKLVQRLGQAVAGRAQSAADERRELPAQHENPNPCPLII